METRNYVRGILGSFLILMPAAVWAQSAGSAFTFQAQLKEGGMPANGAYDFQFVLFDWDGTRVSDVFQVDDHPVTNGLFDVVLDFGVTPFTGQARYLEVGVRPGGSVSGFTALSPRHELTPTPYATMALATVGVDGHSLDASDGSPQNAVYVDTAGNVGIGRTGPAEKLDVAGTVMMTGLKLGTSATPGHVLTANANGEGTWQSPATGGSSPWSTDGDDNIFYGDGNVGIGLGSADPPLVPLHVDGIAYVSEKIGIGTTSPAYPLHVTVPGTRAVVGESSATYGRGVQGEVTGTGGYGVRGQAVDGTGVHGEATATIGGKGVSGWVESETGIGVMGQNDADTGDAIGVKGVSGSADGFAGYFEGRGYFSGKVGIGAFPDESMLNVAGDAKADAFKYTVPKERHLSLPICAFRPSRSDVIAGETAFYFVMTDAALVVVHSPDHHHTFMAPVHLPDGAVVTEMTAHFRDNDGGANLQFVLQQQILASPTWDVQDMSSIVSAGGDGEPQALSAVAVNWPIDNSAYAYFVKIGVEEGQNWGISLNPSAVTLTYTVEETD